MAPSIPTKPDEVTARWLASALDLPITGIDTEPIGVGVGLLGDLVRVTPRYDGTPEGAPTSVIVKLPSHAPANKAIGMAFQFYERELRFYEEVAPTSRIRVPKVWYSAMDLATESFVLVLEDLAGLELADQVVGMTVEQATRAVQAIAPFHAQWWQTPELEALDWMPTSDHPITMQAAKLYRDSWDKFVERWSHVVPAGGLDVGAAVRDVYEQLLVALARPPRTITHTDFRLDNLFFGEKDVVAIDWQLTTRSGGAYDVAYLLAQSMEVQLRRDNERDILRAWYDRLCAAGVRDFSFEQAYDDYAAGILICLVIPVNAGADIDLGNERGEALMAALTTRGFSAALDLDWQAVLDRLTAG